MSMRFGFAVKVIGHGGKIATIDADAGMPSNDARCWQSEPHVRQSIEYVREIFHYCTKRTFTCILCRRILRLT